MITGRLILVRNPDDNFEILHHIEGDGFPVTSLSMAMDHWLFCGYTTGRLRIFKKENNFQLHAEVAAHSRAITALDVHDHQVATVSEDTFLNIWELTSSKTSAKVKLVSSQCVQNDLLTGVAFAGAKSIVTASFDTAHLKLWVPE
ncbi:hypothetical protein FI667_g469, partial [Globisporangium splendens]